MTIAEIEKEIEQVERGAVSNNDQRFIAGIVARGLWQLVLQQARANEITGQMRDLLVKADAE